MKKLKKRMETVTAAEVAREAHEAHKEAKSFLSTLNAFETLGFLVSCIFMHTGVFQVILFEIAGCFEPIHAYWLVAFKIMCCVTVVHITNLVSKATRGTDLFYGAYLWGTYHWVRIMAKEMGWTGKPSRRMYDSAYLILLDKYVAGKEKRIKEAREKLSHLFLSSLLAVLLRTRRKEGR